MMDGSGVYIYKNYDIYKGELNKNKKHGKGSYYYNNGNIYEGGWENNLKKG